MLKNYFKTALRFLSKNKLFTWINILGLSIALAVSFIILLYAINELSYDHCHKNRKQVYRVLTHYVNFKKTDRSTPYILADALKDEFPQVEMSCRTTNASGLKLKLNDEYIRIKKAVGSDPDIFDIFTISVLNGDTGRKMLADKNSIVLSKTLADMFFPGSNPVGKDIAGLINNEEQIFTVTGVYKDIPSNSSFKADCIINVLWTVDPISKAFNVENAGERWDLAFWDTWVRLKKGSNVEDFERQLRNFEKKNMGEKPEFQFSLQNLSDVYLGSDTLMNPGTVGNKKNIRLFLTIGFLIVLVAAINYVILSNAVSTSRAKEIGIRKATGADKGNLRRQLLGESIILCLIVLPVAMLLMFLIMPYTGKLFQTDIRVINSNIITYVLIYLTLTVLIGMASGIYTSLYLSRLKVVDIIKSTNALKAKKHLLRSSLIAFQLIVFCSFVSCTFIINSQYKFALKKDTGYYTKDILVVDLANDSKDYSAYINGLKQNPDVLSAGGAMYALPMVSSSFYKVKCMNNSAESINMESFPVDYHFLETMGIKPVQGRSFSEEYGSDLKNSTLLNETAVKQLGIQGDPVGQTVTGRTIIGVVKDFNLHSIHSDIPPLQINMTDKYISQIAVRYKPGTLNSALLTAESEWKKFEPGKPFNYQTIDDILKDIYSSEKNLSTIVSIFALFTLIIAAFGLFGLTLYIMRTKTKEIGIRKVFGCSEQLITLSFLKDNFLLVLVSSLISIPVTIHFMSRWLSKFPFRTNIEWWFFAAAFVIALVVVLSTVYLHSYKASRLNPVKAIRYE